MIQELQDALAFIEEIFARLVHLMQDVQGKITLSSDLHTGSSPVSWVGEGRAEVPFGAPLPALGQREGASPVYEA